MTLQPSVTSLTGFALILFAGTLFFGGSLQAADVERCARQARNHLSELRIGPDQVDSMRLIAQIPINEKGGADTEDMEAWVRLKSCKGWLIISMSAACYVRQSYTRGECRVEGLANY
jgi:hypothetical protein